MKGDTKPRAQTIRTGPQLHKPTDPAPVLVAFQTLELRYKLHYARFHHTGKSTRPN